MSHTHLERAAFLDRARAEASRLIEARAAAPRRPLRFDRSPRAWVARPYVLVAACALAVLVVTSGALAWIARRPAPAPVVVVVRALPTPARAIVTPPAPPPVVAVAPVAIKQRSKRPPPPAPTPPRVVDLDDEPFGDVIEVKAPVRLAPLFDAKEYKSRGVLVKPEGEN